MTAQEEQKQIEDLMKPRFVLISPFPYCKEEIGFIYEGNKWNDKWWKQMELCKANFRKIEWHEHLKQSDMPEYVKVIGGYDFHRLENGAIKKGKWEKTKNGESWLFDGGTEYIRLQHCVPATSTEYTEYINKLK